MIKARYNVNEDLDMCQSLLHKVMFTQMNAKKGIYIFGERAIAATFDEYKQLYYGPITGKPVVAPFNPGVLTPHTASCEIYQE